MAAGGDQRRHAEALGEARPTELPLGEGDVVSTEDERRRYAECRVERLDRLGEERHRLRHQQAVHQPLHVLGCVLVAKGRVEEAQEVAARHGIDLETPSPEARPQEEAVDGARLSAIRLLFSRHHFVATVLFGVASFFGLLLVYGLNTWLPQIMREAGYPLGSSLRFLLVLNLGAIVGTLLVSVLADRFGSRPVTTCAFTVAATAIFALSTQPSAFAPYALIAVAGFGTVGTQILVNGYVATYYPAGSRASALGWSLGVGRLGAVGGWVLASGLGIEWNFYGFVLPAVLGALVIAAVPGPVGARREPAVYAERSPSRG